MDNNNIRIKDIAKLAGVSVGTVDRVIHSRGKVSSKALQKVMEIINQTGYQPNLLARTLGSNKKYLIATLIPDPSLDEYWEQSFLGVKEAETELAQYNIQVKTFLFDLYDKSSFNKCADEVIKANPDALMTAPIFYHEAVTFFNHLKNQSIPYILFNTSIPEIEPACFIGQDLYQSGKLGAELLDISCKSSGTFAILHIYEDIHNSIHLAEKEKGFKDYFKEKNNSDFKAIGIDMSNPAEPTLEKELSDLLADPQIRGLLVTTSKGAYMTASFLEKHNRTDIQLVGYDLLKENIHYLEKGIINFLIHQDPKNQASLGMTYLSNHLLFKKEIPKTDLFPLNVITRQNYESFLKL